MEWATDRTADACGQALFADCRRLASGSDALSSPIVSCHRNGGTLCNAAHACAIGHFYTKDHLGSVREMTDSSQSIQSQFSYDPWGVPMQIAGTGATPDFGFDSYYVHQRSGLSLTRTRAYSASLGRWLSRDPLGESGTRSLTLYGYVRNNPIRLVDPSGLCDGEVIVDTANDENGGSVYGDYYHPDDPGARDPWFKVNMNPPSEPRLMPEPEVHEVPEIPDYGGKYGTANDSTTTVP